MDALARNFIRGPGLAVLVPGPTMMESLQGKGGVPFEEGLLRAGDRVLLSNMRISQAIRSDESVAIALPCWTGTFSAYPEPGRMLGRVIDSEDPGSGTRWVFPVPEAFWREKDAVLVAEHPDYVLERDGRFRVVHAFSASLVRAFPNENGWYLVDPGHAIPAGAPSGPADPDASYLSRSSSFVGPVARLPLFHFGNEKRRDVCVEMKPCRSLGLVVEAPLEGLPPHERSLPR